VLDDVVDEPPVAAAQRAASALTTPVDTVDSKPSGLPIAMASWPGRARVAPSTARNGRALAVTRMRARSVAGSSADNLSRQLLAARQVCGQGRRAVDDVGCW